MTFYTIFSEKKSPPALNDTGKTDWPVGTVRLFFPDTLPLAAPFILFRMKRTGFSNCRVTVTKGGLQLTAIR